MKYKVTHTTQYYYGEQVPLCHNVVHLKPRDTERQTCLSHAIGISPSPTTMRERLDFFGNPVEWFSVQEPHETLKIVAQSLVQVKGGFEPPTGLWWPAWDEVARMLGGRRDAALLDARQFTFDSTFVPIDAELAEYARPSFAPGRPMLDCVVELTNRIYSEFKFDSGVTTIGTPVLDVLHHRHGVCQDFAHLQIGCLRSLGLAARYVSGYLVTRPPPGRARLVGADTSHAWVSAYFPDYGWIDFDPTNGLIPAVGHITLGWARDYDDISPVRGVVVGGRHHRLGVSVDVEPLNTEDRRPSKIMPL
ncbi:MAG: transglutaminase domain protein [Phycisphaerales bacterium]|nr:transglutaminase domain protein [Phycisphaerales bacterium]